ncbi:RES family NAD+ phosphorylase [Variovorax ginsengisoli]|uniref:RES family NAD+ phosphorylase n=1 Tax=Variovorax ginsengisoli TaxID=363844 RepID=A0ABT8SIF3_9BURK|nr:RES family NAD+ phosphorylase [Variovorax ginsengisoli]MDN8618777.1 RES family NAD+ phosphorylase [Variovorax ginsengisoli]MDO1537947.1 RES family NAD+ phosphorylase [Variovorax ginsengisoli]
MTLSVWRICTTKGLRRDQLGYGSTLSPGRWHLPPPDGQSVVYAGGSRAICQLEKRVHCNGVKPIGQALIRLDLPDAAELQDVREGFELPADWIDQEALTQTIGVAWRKAGDALGLWVPSAVESSESNIVLNPDHPAFLQVVVTVERNPFEFDDRMFP